MPREPVGFRDMLAELMKEHPMLLSKTSVCEMLEVSRTYLDKLIREGKITYKDGKVPIGSVARYLCG